MQNGQTRKRGIAQHDDRANSSRASDVVTAANQ